MNKIINFFIEMSLADKIIFGLCILIAIGIFVCIYNLLKIGASSTQKIFEYTSTREINRKIALEDAYKSMGAQETKGFINHIDKKITQSGLKNLIKKLNAEIFVIITLAFGVIGFVISSILTKNMLFGIIVFVVVCLIFYALLEFRCTYVYRKEEKCLMMFMNLIHSYSVMTDDIIQILDMTTMHIPDPLKSKIQDACVEARISGDVTEALRNLSLKVSHEKLNEALSNFEIGSKYQANYSEMVEAMTEDFRIYLKQKDENKAGSSAALIVQLIIFGAGFGMVHFANGMLETGTVTDMLLKTTIGNFILGYFLVIILILIIKNLRSIR